MKGTPQQFSWRHRRRDGALIDTEISLKAVEVGGRTMILGALRDVTEQLKAEEELRRQHGLMEAVMEGSTDAIFVKDREGRYLLVNTAGLRILGRPLEKVIGRTDTELFPPDMAALHQASDRRIIDSGESETYEQEVRLGSKTVHWFTAKAPYRDEQGDIVGVVGVAHDLTQLVEARNELAALARRHEAVLASVPDIVMEVDEEKVYTWANPAGLEFFGEDAIGREAADYFVGEQDTYERVQPLFDGSEDVLYVESWQRRRDGEARLLGWWCRVLKDSGGTFKSGISTARDITESRRAEEALRESEERLRRVIESMPVLMDAFDEDGTVVFWNRECERVTGYTADEVVGRPEVLETLYPDARYREDKLREWDELGEGYRDREWRLTCKDGTERTISWYDLSAHVRIPGWSSWGVGVDITRRRRAEEDRRRLEAQVRHAQKLESLGVLAGGIAHDFNNLLTGVLGHARLARMKLQTESPAIPSLEQIEKASERANELCRQMLAYSGKGRFTVKTIDLSALVEEMVHMVEMALSKKAELSLSLGRDLSGIDADDTQVRQIVMNLVTNASEAIGDRVGTISVTTGSAECTEEYLSGTYLDESLPEGEYVFVEVSDSGCGMDQETLGKIFDPFFTTKFSGRGLGLAAVLGIVRGHRAAIRVESEPERGTNVRVLFPASEEQVGADPVGERPATERRGSGTILVVDDEETVRRFARESLELAGFDVLTAGDGLEALELYRQHTDEIRLVILDLTMPHLDGEETFQRLKALRADVRVVLSSGYDEQDATSRFAGKDEVTFLQKPYYPEGLLESVFGVLDT
jgi:PAS domain S-box-containing protein